MWPQVILYVAIAVISAVGARRVGQPIVSTTVKVGRYAIVRPAKKVGHAVKAIAKHEASK